MSRNGWRQAGILRLLASHPDGLSTAQIAELTGEDMGRRTRALSKSGGALRKLEQRGSVERCGIVAAAYNNVPTLVWRIKEAGLEVAAKESPAPLVPVPVPVPVRSALTATPAIWQLMALLPPEGSEFPAWRRRLWLIAVGAVLDFVYAENEQDVVFQ